MTTRLAVFDCDGTLVDGQASICDCMETAFDVAGLARPDRHDVRRIVGLSLPGAIQMLAPDGTSEQHAAALDAYKSAFRALREQGALQEPLFPGIGDLLDRLRADGWQLAVATGKSDRGLDAMIAAHGLTGHFASLQTADRHPSKPHPAMLEAALFETGAKPGEAVMIGDTHYDMQMAHAAGVRAIGVAWGYHDADELLAAGAEGVAANAEELGEILR